MRAQVGNSEWGSTNKKLSDSQIDVLMKLSKNHRFKWYSTSGSNAAPSGEYIYNRATQSATYSTTELIEQQCTRTPDGQWSKVYATSGGLDFGLATRDYRVGAGSSTSVICKVDADNCFTTSQPNAYCDYKSFITMRYSKNDDNRHYDVCVRQKKCSTTRNAVVLLG